MVSENSDSNPETNSSEQLEASQSKSSQSKLLESGSSESESSPSKLPESESSQSESFPATTERPTHAPDAASPTSTTICLTERLTVISKERQALLCQLQRLQEEETSLLHALLVSSPLTHSSL